MNLELRNNHWLDKRSVEKDLIIRFSRLLYVQQQQQQSGRRFWSLLTGNFFVRMLLLSVGVIMLMKKIEE